MMRVLKTVKTKLNNKIELLGNEDFKNILVIGVFHGDEPQGKFLIEEIGDMKNLKIILTLGGVAHNAVLGVLGYKKAAFKFAHNAVHNLDKHNLLMVNSYHTSRYNINTGVLTPEMFRDVIRNILNLIK